MAGRQTYLPYLVGLHVCVQLLPGPAGRLGPLRVLARRLLQRGDPVCHALPLVLLVLADLHQGRDRRLRRGRPGPPLQLAAPVDSESFMMKPVSTPPTVLYPATRTPPPAGSSAMPLHTSFELRMFVRHAQTIAPALEILTATASRLELSIVS